jgi:hypothetical protein
MQNITVLCPECGAEVALTESLAAPLLEASKKEFERKLAEKNKELRDQASEMERRREALSAAEEALDATIQERVKAVATGLTADAERKARALVEEEMAGQKAALEDAAKLVRSRTDALKDATEAAASLRREKAELEEEKLRLATSFEDKVGEELRKARVRYAAEYQSDLAKKLAAKDEEIAQAKLDSDALSEEAHSKARAEVEAEITAKSDALREAEKLLKLRTDSLKEANDAAASLRQEKAELEEEKVRLSSTIESKVKEELRKAKEKYEVEFKSDLARKIAEKEEELAQANKELETAKQTEAEFLRARRQFENEKRQMPLTIQQKVNEEVTATRIEMDKEMKLQVRAKDVVLESMKAEIENLKRKSEQGSQQVQGEVWEKEVSDVLSAKFPGDIFRRVAKGESGADIVHDVYNSQGKLCGSLLWESKKTKTWKDEWLGKLKKDQRAIKADTAVIVSHVLPKDMTTFDNREDVWVTGPDCLVAVAGALRHLLIEVASTKRSNEGHKDKAGLVYDYVTSLSFRQRVKALVETYTAMQADLKAERKVFIKQWAKREAQLDRMIEATSGMYGDLQGIAGQNVPELEGLSFEALEAGE